MDTVATTKTEIVEKTPSAPLPMMEINVGGALQKPAEKEIVSDDQMISIYTEILEMCRDDRKEVDDLLGNFVNMVLNEGDASTSSKEALVNLMKIRTDIANNMSRVFDLLARIKMRDRSLPDVVAKQVNKFNIGGQPKRNLLDKLSKEAAKKKEQD